MTDVFDATLQLWGRAFGVRLPDDEPAPNVHVLARARQFGAKSRREFVHEIVGRDGTARRTLMARELGACGVRRVPMDYVDPVRSRDDSGRYRGLGLDPMETPEVQTAQRAWIELQKWFPDQAEVLRYEYQRPDLATQQLRARAIGITHRQYVDKLTAARHWVRCALAMNAVVERANS